METSRLTGHISRRFNKDIEDLRNSVLAMGGLVESQLSQAIAAIVSGDSELGLQVARDDYKVNNLEVEIDEECGRILATRAPAATDLRLIVAIIKTITDLERIGDEAEKIGYLASRLALQERRSNGNAPGTAADDHHIMPGGRGSASSSVIRSKPSRSERKGSRRPAGS